MRAVVLAAAGKDSLHPFTETKPVCLLPPDGEPLLARLIRQLRSAGVEDVYVVTNHLEHQVEEFAAAEGIETVHQEELGGTGKALAAVEETGEETLVVNGDVVVSQRDVQGLVEKHEGTGSDCTVLGTHEPAPEKFGVLSIRDDNLTALEEKPEEAETTLVNTGIYCFSPRVFDSIEENGFESLTDAVRSLKDSTKVHVAEDYWVDIGSRRKLLEASRRCREEIERSVHEDAEVSEKAVLEGEVVVKKGAEVSASAHIVGPVVIGEGARIGPQTLVRESVVGESSQLESCTVSGSVLFENVIVDSSCSIEESVLGEGADLKAGTSMRQCFIGAESFIDFNNSMRGCRTVPDARTDLGEITK